MNQEFYIKNTESFAVFEHAEDRRAPSSSVRRYFESSDIFLSGILKNGCYLGNSKIFARDKLEVARNSIKDLVSNLKSIYDETADEFSDFDMDNWRVVRTPRINPGKHNIHFDPFESEQHDALADMAAASDLENMLTDYQHQISKLDISDDEDTNDTFSNRRISLRETGLSLTAPNKSKRSERSGCGDQFSFGNGMELHSDGCKGENTVLFSFDDISFEKGPLLVSPMSQNDYVDGIGHPPLSLASTERSIYNNNDNNNKELCNEDKTTSKFREVLYYSYEAGRPMIIDARTLHGALPNISDRWRVICWFIYEYI